MECRPSTAYATMTSGGIEYFADQSQLMKSLFRNDRIYHVLIWLLLIVPRGFGSIYIAKTSVGLYLLNMLLQNGLLLGLVYLNLLYLIPTFYGKRKFVKYFVYLIVLVDIYITSILVLNQQMNKILALPNESSDWRFEVLFYFFNTCGYLVTSFLLYALQERFQQRKQLDDMQVQKLNAEMNYLKAQINPHFLFNTLNNLYALSLEKSDRAPDTILMLSKMMDYMIYETAGGKVELKKELENLKNYVGLERIRQGNEASIQFEIKGEVNDQKITPLILLPLVENAFKHGPHQMIHGSFVEMLVRVERDSLELNVRNNFKEKNENGHGIGLTNLKKQLQLFYPARYELKVEKQDDLFTGRLKLTL